MSFDAHVQARLEALHAQGLHRRARTVDGPQGPRFVLDGHEVLCLCSNNYLGLAGSSQLTSAAARALDALGAGSGASRLISGSMRVHLEAEAGLADFVQQPAAALFSSGYAANVGALQALAGRDDVLFSDSLNHASLIDGARLSRARVVIFEHGDLDDLARKLNAERASGQAAFVVTESLFSMDGDRAPLAALRRLADAHDAALIVDEAHALGVYGPEGRGLCAEEGVAPDVLIGTLGKAFGAQGAFVASSAAAIDLLRNRARSYVFSTAPAAPVAALALAALDQVRAADDRREVLHRHARRLREGLIDQGYELLPGDSPILPVRVGDPGPTMALSHALLERGVFAHGIRPPTVPVGQGRLRVVPMATHTDADIDTALEAFAALRA